MEELVLIVLLALQVFELILHWTNFYFFINHLNKVAVNGTDNTPSLINQCLSSCPGTLGILLDLKNL